MKEILISICIPAYNGAEYISQCIDSVCAQNYKNTEIIICDDCSVDSTIEIVKAKMVGEPRIQLFINEKNLGLVSNWNKCIELAKGEWIKFVFQDDYIDSDCIEKMLDGANGDSLVACKRSFLLDSNADDKTKNYYQNEVVTFDKLGIPSERTFILPEVISQMAAENICMNFIGEPTSIMFKRSVIDKLGLFNSNLAQICDLEYFLRIATNYGVRYIPESLTRFRIHALSTTSSNLNDKMYTLSNIDPIAMVRQLLYGEQYLKFRNVITNNNKIRLKNFFAVRVYEAYKIAALAGSQSKEMDKFNSIAKIYPEINAFKYPGLNTKLLYKLVKLRRKLRSIFNG